MEREREEMGINGRESFDGGRTNMSPPGHRREEAINTGLR